MVGAIGATFNTVLFLSLIRWLRLDPVAAGAIATELAIFCNFALNDLWTFSGRPYRRSWPVRAIRYNAIASAGWAFSVLVLAMMIHVFGLQPLVANIFALGSSFAVNYLANKHFTFTAVILAPDESPI